MEKILQKPAKEIMTKDVIAVQDDESIKNLFQIMDKNNILGVPVIDCKNKLIGIVTETNLIQHFTTLKNPKSINILGGILYLDSTEDFNKNLKSHCAEYVKDIMTKDVISVNSDVKLKNIINLMSEKNINRLPVIDNQNKLIGIITRSDIVHQLAKIKSV